MTTSPLSQSIDRQQLLERCLGIDTFADKLVATFVSSLSQEREELQSALEQKNLEGLARTAHRLRGSAANLCAGTLRDAATAVELAAKETLWDELSPRFQQLDQAIQQILSEHQSPRETP
jgi:HPt (histidine-containing phosphotransfer) domain-containing protein